MPGRNTNIEHSIILKLKEGNRKAFNQLFCIYNQKLYFFALGYVKSDQDAEEIVQDTFLKIWEHRDAIDPELSLQSYIFKIAFNFIRKRWIRKMKDDELKHDLAGELLNFDNRTAGTLNYHSLLEYINQLIGQLPPRQKQILTLRKLEDYKIKEIAIILDLSEKTVEAHLSAALKFLRGKLQSEKFDDLLLLALIFKKNFHRTKGKIISQDITYKGRLKNERET